MQGQISVEQVMVALGGGSTRWAGAEEVGGAGAARSGSRAEWVALVLAGCDRLALAALAVSSGLCRPTRDDAGGEAAWERQAWRGEVLEALDAHARELSLRSRRGWPAGYATALAKVALRELEAAGERWTDTRRREMAARLHVRISAASWSETWGARYQQVLGEAHRLAGEAVRHIKAAA